VVDSLQGCREGQLGGTLPWGPILLQGPWKTCKNVIRKFVWILVQMTKTGHQKILLGK